MTDYTNPEVSCIRRAPTMDTRLAQAIQKLHDLGPRLVVELEAEIESLQNQLERLRTTASVEPGKSAELVGLLKG